MSERSGRILWGFVVFLCFLLWLQSYQGRIHTWNAQVDYCNQVTLPASRDSEERDNDLQVFASSSAAFRASTGRTDLAAQSAGVAKRAKARSERTKSRAAVPCTERFVKPSPFWG